MRILAVVDTHEDAAAMRRLAKVVAQERVDIVACMGDFTIFGRGTAQMLKKLDALGVPVVLIHGNHEDEDEVVAALASCTRIHWAHERAVEVLGVRFIGFGGHGFRRKEPALEALERKLAHLFDPRTVVLCHAPPYGTKLDEVEPGWHVGNESLTRLIRRRAPMLALCGHIHQCFHARDRIGGTLVVNPGPDGEIFEVEP